MTPAEARIEDRRRALWLLDYGTRPLWSWSAAVLWVAYRDPAALALWIRDNKGAETLPENETQIVHGEIIARAVVADEAAVEPLPLELLTIALKAGTVKAQGVEERPQDNAGRAPPSTIHLQPIPAADWSAFRLSEWYQTSWGVERARIGESPHLVPADWKWGTAPNSFGERLPPRAWSRVQIERESLFTAYPPSEERAASLGWASAAVVTIAPAPPLSAPEAPDLSSSDPVARLSQAEAWVVQLVNDHPEGPPPGYDREALVEALAKEFSLHDADARSARKRGIERANPTSSLAWSRGGRPKSISRRLASPKTDQKTGH